VDVNELQNRAALLRSNGHFQKAIDVYLYLADGDPSLDAGWYAIQIAECCEKLGRMTEARYWAARAKDENPTVPDRQEIEQRLGPIKLAHVDGSPPASRWLSSSTDQQLEETQRLLKSIPGGQELLEWLGGASFHDAEVLSLHLDRETGGQLEVFAQGRGTSGVVTFTLHDWIDVEIAGFSHQNVIGDLILRSAAAKTLQPWELGVAAAQGSIELVMMPIFGANGTIRASIRRIQVERGRRVRSLKRTDR